MTSRVTRRVLMVLAGASLTAAGLLAVPGAGGAVVDIPDPGLTSTTLPTLPPEFEGVIDQIEGITGSTVTTTTSTTTTTTPELTTTTTTTQPRTTTTQPSAEQKRTEANASVAGTPLEELLAQIEVPIIDVQAIVADYGRTEFPAYTPRFGKRSTLELVQLLGERGLSPDQQAQIIAPFPVAGAASYTDDWGAPRYSPTFHLHEGTDIFAAMGTPVIATMAGTVSRVAPGTPVGGNVVYLEMADGTYFYYAHLDAISPLIYVGTPVEPGQILGTVGNTGNADGGMPHLHFEIHPGGGDPVPPAPYLDAWLAAALDEARQVAGAAVAPPPFPTALPGSAPTDAGVLPTQPASFGRDSTGTLLFVIPGALVLWWRRRRAAAVMKTILAKD